MSIAVLEQVAQADLFLDSLIVCGVFQLPPPITAHLSVVQCFGGVILARFGRFRVRHPKCLSSFRMRHGGVFLYQFLQCGALHSPERFFLLFLKCVCQFVLGIFVPEFADFFCHVFEKSLRALQFLFGLLVFVFELRNLSFSGGLGFGFSSSLASGFGFRPWLQVCMLVAVTAG